MKRSNLTDATQPGSRNERRSLPDRRACGLGQPRHPADPGEGTGCVLMAPWPVCRSENGPGPPQGMGG